MAVEIQIRRDTAANWTADDPTPAQGELCLETDTGKIKVGDGSSAWSALSYFTTGVNSVTAADSTVTIGGTSSAPTVARAAITGDVSVPSGSDVASLAASGVTAGSYTAADITVDAKGRITSASSGAFVASYVTSIGDGASLTYTVTHDLNSTDVAVTVRDTTVGDIVYPTVDVVDANNISVTFGTAPTSNEMRVLVGRY